MENLTTRNDYIVIRGGQRQNIHSNDDSTKLFRIHSRSKQENFNPQDNKKECEVVESESPLQRQEFLDDEVKQKVKKKKKKKHKKKNKYCKNKKQKKKRKKELGNNLGNKGARNGNLLAEILKCSKYVMVVDKTLFVYDKRTGCMSECSRDDASIQIRSLLSKEERLRVSSIEYKEAYEQLLISEELVREDAFFANQPYVNCLNGVVDVRNGKLLEHSPDYMFRHCIPVNYIPGAKCRRFLEYIHLITNGNQELILLIRVILGYIFSHYNNAKIAFVLYGIPHTGKSGFCKLVEGIVGTENITTVDLANLCKQEYIATLKGKLLNIAPDLDNKPLCNIGAFKSLVSHNDTISARALYSNPIKIKGGAKMLFSTNHLIELESGVCKEDALALFNRMMYIPFQNPAIKAKEENKNFSQELLEEEREGIFAWAMEGLSWYIKNGERFPKSELSEELKQKNMAAYCPEETFFDRYFKMEEGAIISTKVVRDLFEDFCGECNVSEHHNIHQYLKHTKRIPTSKIRMDKYGNRTSCGNPIATYVGIKLRKEYREEVFGSCSRNDEL